MKYRLVVDGNNKYKVQHRNGYWDTWQDISLSFDKYSDAKYIFNSYKLEVLDKM